MNHIFVPAAVTVLAIGAVWSLVGWLVHHYVEAVSVRTGQWIFLSGLGVVALGVLLYIWPLSLMFFAHPV